MKERIIIGPSISSYVNMNRDEDHLIERVDTFRTDDMLNGLIKQYSNSHFDKNCSFELNSLPKNTIYYNDLPHEECMYIIEQKPRIQTISIDVPDLDNLKRDLLSRYPNTKIIKTSKSKFTLSLPYVVFFIRINHANNGFSVDDISVFFRLSPIQSGSDYLIKANLLNINHNQFCCIGSPPYNEEFTKTTYINNVIDHFWASSFNADYIHNYDLYRNNKIYGHINNYLTWEIASKKNPLFIYKQPWLVHEYNVGKIISKFVPNNNNRNNNVVNIQNCVYIAKRLVNHKKVTELEMPKNSDCNKDEVIINKIKYKLSLSNIFITQIELSIGEEIKSITGKYKFYITGFYTDQYNELKYIGVETPSGKNTFFKYTNKFKEYLENYLLNYEKLNKYTTNDNVEVKPGDIIEIKSPYSMIGEVERIINTEDGFVEFVINSKRFIANYIDSCEIVNMENQKYNNIPLIHNNVYVLLDQYSSSITLLIYNKSTYIKRLGSNTTFISHIFKIKDGIDTVTLNSQDSKQQICREEDFNIIGGDENPIIIGDDLTTKTFYYIEKYGYKETNTPDSPKKTLKEILSYILIDDNKHLFIRSFSDNENIDFRIGDKVFCFDYSVPDSIIMKTITKFTFNEILNESEYSIQYILNIEMEDNNGKKTTVEYIADSIYKCKVRKGCIRHATQTWDEYCIGDVFKATQSYIPYFPKKNKNVLCGFITETDREPLAVFDNGLTIWGNDLIDNFDKLSTDKLITLDNFNLNPRLQPGDIIYSNANDVPHSFEQSVNKYKYQVVIIGDRVSKYNVLKYNDMVAVDRYKNISNLEDIWPSLSIHGILYPRKLQKDIFEGGSLLVNRKVMSLNGNIKYDDILSYYKYYIVDHRK